MKITKQEQQSIIDKCRGRCAYCQIALNQKTYQIEHFIPISKGGIEGENLLIACIECNTRKGNRMFDTLADARLALGYPAVDGGEPVEFDSRGDYLRRGTKGNRREQNLRYQALNRVRLNLYRRNWRRLRKKQKAAPNESQSDYKPSTAWMPSRENFLKTGLYEKEGSSIRIPPPPHKSPLASPLRHDRPDK